MRRTIKDQLIEDLPCVLNFTMPLLPINISSRTCHCAKEGYLTKDRRYPITALEQNCMVTFQTVFSSDSGVCNARLLRQDLKVKKYTWMWLEDWDLQ